MKEQKDKIDNLLAYNTAEQMADIDWDRLSREISSRLNKTHRQPASAVAYSRAFKIAASIAVAAAIIFIAVMARVDKMQLDGKSAVVKFVDNKATAVVKITPPANKRILVKVDIRTGRRKPATCDVAMVDMKLEKQSKASRATWIIISKPKPVYADNGTSSDISDLIYLF